MSASEAASASESFAVARLKTADVAAMLERLNISDLIDAGAVNVISFDAIRDRMGERWARRREDIWAHIERTMTKALAPQDLFHRLNDTDYVVAVVSDSPVAAQGLCMHILEEVLVFFLGSCKGSDLVLLTVRGIKDGRIDCHTIDADFIARRRDGRPAAPASADEPRRPVFKAPMVSVLSPSGRALKVTFAPEPLVSLRQGLHAGVRVEPTVRDALTDEAVPRRVLAQMSDADLLQIDQAAMEVGVAITKTVASDRPGMILPFSFQTLSSSRARATLLGMASGDLIRQRFLIEIVNIDQGTPNGRLIELAGLLKAHTTGVIARVPPTKGAVDVLRDVRLMAAALDLSEALEDEASILAAMTAFGQRTSGAPHSLHALALPSKSYFGAALKVGMTHASVRRAQPATLAA